MDEADIVEVIHRAENRFGISLPDNGIGFSSTLTDVVDLIDQRLGDKQAGLMKGLGSDEPPPGGPVPAKAA
jgi:hypothetical protein